MANLIERHRNDIRGVLSCLDRVVIQGTIPSICHPKAMATMLDSRGIRLFDYTQFVQPFRDAIRAHAEKIAAEEGVTVEFIRKMKTFRKEDRIQQLLAERGEHPGLVHIFSAMEPCSSYEPWHDKATGNTFLRRDTGKCLHYYFYFIDEVLGLCFLAVPTWCAFRALFYLNGHNWLASQLRSANISYELQDNVFRSAEDLAPLYDHLLRTAIHAVKVDDVATFLGHSPQRIGER